MLVKAATGSWGLEMRMTILMSNVGDEFGEMTHFIIGWQLITNKQRVLMHGHQGWNVRHGLCHIYMICVYIWVVHSFCLFCCLFIIVTTQFVALYEPCKPKPKPKPSTYDTRTTTPWQRSKFRYLDRSQSNKYAINMQIQTISVSK